MTSKQIDYCIELARTESTNITFSTRNPIIQQKPCIYNAFRWEIHKS